MSQTAKISVGDSKDREVWVACGTCNRVTCHRVLTTVRSSEEYDDAGGKLYISEEYMTVECRGCRTLSFCMEASDSDDSYWDPETDQFVYPTTMTLYPNRIAGRPAMQGQALLQIPPGVRRVYQETHQALCNDQPVLTGIGIRAIVEAVCTERQAAGKTLEQKIDDLAAKNVITPDAATILHNLRFMGNTAAHEVMTHTIEELSTAFDVVEYLLQGVYIMPKQAAKLAKKTPK